MYDLSEITQTDDEDVILYRGRDGWTPLDVSNLDAYLAKIISEGLDFLAKKGHGFPAGVYEEGTWTTKLIDLAEKFNHYAHHSWSGTLQVDADFFLNLDAMFKELAQIFPHLWD